MSVTELEKLALELPQADRAALATSLLQSLAPTLIDDDDGLAEAERRDAEMDRDPSIALSFNDFKAQFRKWMK